MLKYKTYLSRHAMTHVGVSLVTSTDMGHGDIVYVVDCVIP